MKPPQVLVTELTNQCASACSFCPRKNIGGKVGFMDMNLFKELIDEAVDLGIYRIIFDKDGDPMQSPNLIDCLEYIRRNAPRMFVSFNTPAVFFPHPYWQQLLEFDLNKICFSILAAHPETYKEITGLDMLERVERNVQDFINLKNMSGARTEIVVKMNLVDIITPREVSDFKHRWNIQGVNQIAVDSVFDWHNLYRKEPCVFTGKTDKICQEPFTALNVNWDGRASLCCLDAKKEYIVGNLNKQTIREVWDGPQLKMYREKMLAGETCELEPCKYCDRWRM